MPFTPDEFVVGMIAYYSVYDVQRHSRIRTNNLTHDKKPRPFVCYGECYGLSYWTAFTTTMRPWRVTLEKRWLRIPKGHPYHCGKLIVSDAATSFVGPIEAFAKLSVLHDRCEGLKRPILLPEGVEELRRQIRVRGGLLPPSPMRLAA